MIRRKGKGETGEREREGGREERETDGWTKIEEKGENGEIPRKVY